MKEFGKEALVSRIEQLKKNREMRRTEEIRNFHNRIGIINNNIDNITIPSIEYLKEEEKNYTSYYISKFPNSLVYTITMHKKEYPFDIYYSKKYSNYEIPKKHVKQFKELEEYFNI